MGDPEFTPLGGLNQITNIPYNPMQQQMPPMNPNAQQGQQYQGQQQGQQPAEPDFTCGIPGVTPGCPLQPNPQQNGQYQQAQQQAQQQAYQQSMYEQQMRQQQLRQPQLNDESATTPDTETILEHGMLQLNKMDGKEWMVLLVLYVILSTDIINRYIYNWIPYLFRAYPQHMRLSFFGAIVYGAFLGLVFIIIKKFFLH